MKKWRRNSSIKTAWKGKEGVLVSESLCGKARQLLLLLDHPWQMTLLKVRLPELRSQALPLTFHRQGNGKIHPVS